MLFKRFFANEPPIAAVLAIRIRWRNMFGVKAFFNVRQHRLNPTNVAGMGNNGHFKFQFPMEPGTVFSGVGKQEIARGRNRKAQSFENPLIHLHLFFISFFILAVQGNFVFRARGFVVYDMQLLRFGVKPNVVDNAADVQIRLSMQYRRPDFLVMIVPPKVQIGMGKRHRINAVVEHQAVRLLLFAQRIEFIFQQRINCAVQRPAGHIGPHDPLPTVEPKTLGALQKEGNF